MKIITNNVPRNIIEAYELSEAEQKEFDYLDWEALKSGNDSASFFRYKGQLYDLGEIEMIPAFACDIKGWNGYQSDSFFSGIVVKYPLDCDGICSCENYDSVIVGRYYC